MSSGRIVFNLPNLLILVACSLSPTVDFAQVDSAFSVTRNGVEAKFVFTKFTRPEQFKTVRTSSLPLYSFNQVQYDRIKGLLVSFVQMENEYQLLHANHDKADSVYALKERKLIDNAQLEQERAKNFETSYDKFLGVNAELNEQVKKAERLAIHEHRRRNGKTILAGVIALSAGVIIGATMR